MFLTKKHNLSERKGRTLRSARPLQWIMTAIKNDMFSFGLTRNETEEFEPLQSECAVQHTEIKRDTFDFASFGRIAPDCHIPNHLPPPNPCTTGDLVTGKLAA
jgi:hypothetical protein